ncbi:MAG TPA: Nudix family hydrolase, partial [Casimicrobiaceae bacterium]|nr:Nudix family hydrolase [Casimicrobiaceae bacterium]
MSGIVRVAAAVIERADGRVLLAQRPPDRAYGGYWEFPGGKLEIGETPEAALARELHEELGIVVRQASPWLTQEFVYPHAHVELNFFRVRAWDGEPSGRDGQAFSWQDPFAIDVTPLLPANTRVLAALALPLIYAITCAADMGEDAFLRRARRALDNGVRLIQIREKTWKQSRRDAFAHALIGLAKPMGARVILNGSEDDARRLGCDGVHWTAAVLAAEHARPRDLLVGASCHTTDEVARAAALDVDFVILGPVFATPTHPDAVPLGWQGFAKRIVGTRVPVYALGGLARNDLDEAIA